MYAVPRMICIHWAIPPKQSAEGAQIGELALRSLINNTNFVYKNYCSLSMRSL